MSWKILVSAPYIQPVIEDYRSILQAADPYVELLVPPLQERLSEEALIELIGDIDGAICGDDSFTERVMQSAPKLKVISKWGTGIDSIDQEAARRHGIDVCNTADAFTDAVADSVLGYMLCFARQIPWMDRDIRAGRWGKRQGFSLKESTLGIIGVGNVGSAVANRAAAFGMTLLGHDLSSLPEGLVSETGIRPVVKADLLAQSDFVSLNCDLNPGSRRIIGEAELNAMKTTAFLINTARGPLVDEEALARALVDGVIAGAGLDVFEDEPLPEDSKLRTQDNCLLAPHNANSSPEAYIRVHENTLKNLIDSLQRKA